MEKISSFTINHERLKRGIFVSRKDYIENSVITTFDIRMKEPNRESALSPSAQHTIEHLAATYLRNCPKWKENVIYWGPMGCLTGSYLILKGDLTSNDIVELMKQTFLFIAQFDGQVPGATRKDCGNAILHSLSEARFEAKKYLEEVLENIKSENLYYPK